MRSLGARDGPSSGRQKRLHALRLTVVMVVLTSAGVRVPGASAQTAAGTGFVISVITNPLGVVIPGETLRYQFHVVNNGSMTTSPLVATDTVPAGTTLVPHSQTCGSAGGACSESSSGSTLEWEIPAGAPQGAEDVFSFAVSVATDRAPAAILTGLTLSGPICRLQAECRFDAPAVAVAASRSTTSVPQTSAPTTTTTNPASDQQDLTVQVPRCFQVNKHVQCPPGVGNGRGTKPGPPISTPPKKKLSGLAFTGYNEVLTIEAGLLAILSGTVLVCVSKIGGRRRADLC